MLSGVRVVEIGQALAAPFAAEILADLGADVIKVEKPDGGDDARHWGAAIWGDDAPMFHQMNRNKRAICVDIKNTDERERLIALIGMPTCSCTICAPARRKRRTSAPRPCGRASRG